MTRNGLSANPRSRFLHASAHQLDHLRGREAVREHARLGAAVVGGGEQLKGAAAVGLRAVATAAGVKKIGTG